ncbi:MAG: CoB--CoM heterodisulfide reductase iron-sulfur subunit A family protein [Euryarchaeota archaeon]|nr:CoB--CoM heterodisulfide reductase iron-sulfur subunit A family protein [Euryarchaeota archaeon]
MSDEGSAGGTILVVGGGISGITTAVEAAETGYNVVLVEKNPSLGGRVAQLSKYFPKLCPPYCGLEINLKRIKTNPNITCYTLAELESVSGGPGAYDVKIKVNPRYVNDNCTACGKCAEAVSTEIPNEFNFGMDTTKAAYLPHELAFPFRYVLSPKIIGTEDAQKAAAACKYNAIDLDMQPETIELKVGSIVYATGWEPFDATKIENLDVAGKENVINNMQMERLASSNGPTGGRIQRPSDGKEVESIAFVQCAGSRDENYLPYCSAICCLASMKQATYIREQNPDSKVYIFYIDIRAPGKYELFYQRLQEDENVSFIKGKVAQINEDADKGLEVVAEDIQTGNKVRQKVDMVVLATGMVPATAGLPQVETDESGFAIPKPGIYSTGVAKKPMEVAASVQDATGAALKAIQTARD